jgi:hypothetical protein
MKYKFLLVPFVLSILGCGLVTQTIAPIQTVPVPPTTAPANMPTVVIADTQVPSATVPPAVTATSSQGFALPSMFMNLQNVQQYLNPSGAPVKVWHDIPIMPQATAGQDFNNGVYSYKATAILKQASAFYSQFTPSGMPATRVWFRWKRNQCQA